jgi:hypothetical protein
VPWRPWSFRYFLPALLPVLASGLGRAPLPGLAVLAVVLAGWNVHAVYLQRGEALPAANLAAALEDSERLSPAARRCGFQPYLMAGIPAGRVLLLAEGMAPIGVFFGADGRNHVTLVNDIAALETRLAGEAWVAVAIAGGGQLGEEEFWRRMETRGYAVTRRDRHYRVALSTRLPARGSSGEPGSGDHSMAQSAAGIRR